MKRLEFFIWLNMSAQLDFLLILVFLYTFHITLNAMSTLENYMRHTILVLCCIYELMRNSLRWEFKKNIVRNWRNWKCEVYIILRICESANQKLQFLLNLFLFIKLYHLTKNNLPFEHHVTIQCTFPQTFKLQKLCVGTSLVLIYKSFMCSKF